MMMGTPEVPEIPEGHRSDRPKTPKHLLGWKRQAPSTSEQWAQALPKGPLVADLAGLHSILLYVGATGDALEIAEEHLRRIAVYTQQNERYGR